jgi:CAAX prenyl protease-like protein
LPWVVKEVPRSTSESATSNPTAAYLLPLVTILAAGMISTAASSGFEWLYPLRFFAAVVAIWYFRASYRKMDWRFSWLSVTAGILVFGIWIGMDQLVGSAGDRGTAASLASMPLLTRLAWLTFRTAAAIITVPIAEELAFRGFLIRRLISSDFEVLPASQYTLMSVVVSSTAFGLLHGQQWIAGVLAGLIFAVAWLRRGRIGDAVVAHATANALLAAWVLQGGRWYLW